MEKDYLALKRASCPNSEPLVLVCISDCPNLESGFAAILKCFLALSN
jgi:hypothetical protein